MSSSASSTVNTVNNLTRKITASSPVARVGIAVIAGALAAGYTVVSLQTSPTRHGHTSLESQFGTSDGYFPTATRGASLAKPPGNKEHIVGEHYVANDQRRSYPTRRYAKKTTSTDNERRDVVLS